MQKISHKNSWFLCIGILVLFMLPYVIVNHLPMRRNTLPFILGEERIPFLAWTFIIYISAYLQGILVLREIPKDFLRKALFFAFTMIAIGVIFFIFFPIEYPRELYWGHSYFLDSANKLDTPANCFPSLHVAMTIFISFCFSLLQKPKIQKLLMWIWTAAIILSVLTTKQHYALDAIGGIILAIPLCIIFNQKVRQSL